MSLPTVQHSIMVSAMSLLLVFRTNSALFFMVRFLSFEAWVGFE